jgi:site-specific recombinase XerD
MASQGIADYSPKVGQTFLEDYFSKHQLLKNASKRSITAVVRRLDDVVLCRASAYHAKRVGIRKSIPACFRTILDGYLRYCEEIGNKQVTLKRKRQYCELFLRYADALGCDCIEQLTSELVTQACLQFHFKGGWPFVGLFLRYLFEAGIIQGDLALSVPHVRRSYPLPTVYSEKEVVRLEQSIDRNTKVGMRDYAILLLASRCGIRCGDIALLRFENVDTQHNAIRLIQQKTEQPLTLPLLPEVKTALLDYIGKARPHSDSPFVFLTVIAPFKSMTSAGISMVVKRAFEKSGLEVTGKKHGPHALRASLATSMVNDNVPYEAVRKVLGHANPNTIRHYAKVHIEKLREYAIPTPSPCGAFADALSKEV